MLVDESVFRDSHRPQRLLHRDSEQQTLARAFEPALEGDCASDVLLHGPQGVGKSILTRHVLNRLDERGDIQVATVHCLGKDTDDIVRSVLAQLGVDVDAGTPEHDCCLRLQQAVDSPTIVVLDEGDGLPTTDAFDRLWDIDLCSVAVICHDHERWLRWLDYEPRHQWHDAVNLHLDRYAPAALADILEPRARKGLRHGAVEREVLEEIGDATAGSARWAITALHAAATVAEERGHDTIREQHVPAGVERGKDWIREQQLRSLDIHHQVLYEIIRDAGEIAGVDLHGRYERIAADAYRGETRQAIKKRARRVKLSKLAEYGLIEHDGVYRVIDPTISSPLDIEVPVKRH